MFEQNLETTRAIVFSPLYPGYRPTVVESPNGDGKKDTEKRYAHIAAKYRHPSDALQLFLDSMFDQAHALALEVAQRLRVPEMYRPDPRYGALRILEYPVGSFSHEHTDFDLFTIMLHRSQPDKFVSDWHNMPPEVSAVNRQCHMGEIGELVGLGKATVHSVLPSDTLQVSAVYFAIPDHDAVLPNGVKVGDWIAERISRSRYDK